MSANDTAASAGVGGTRGRGGADGGGEDASGAASVVHLIGFERGTTSCCGRVPFELPRTDRLSSNTASTTCAASHPMTTPREEASGATREGRAAPPPCEPQPPLCGICGNETWHDGNGWTCDDCMASWPTEAQSQREVGEWDNVFAAACESIDGRYLPGGVWWSAREAERFVSRGIPVFRRCLLHAEHSGDHTWKQEVLGRFCWTDTTAATAEQLSQVTQ